MSIEVIVLIALALTAAYLIIIYNKFVSLKAGIDASESDINVQLRQTKMQYVGILSARNGISP